MYLNKPPRGAASSYDLVFNAIAVQAFRYLGGRPSCLVLRTYIGWANAHCLYAISRFYFAVVIWFIVCSEVG